MLLATVTNQAVGDAVIPTRSESSAAYNRHEGEDAPSTRVLLSRLSSSTPVSAESMSPPRQWGPRHMFTCDHREPEVLSFPSPRADWVKTGTGLIPLGRTLLPAVMHCDHALQHPPHRDPAPCSARSKNMARRTEQGMPDGTGHGGGGIEHSRWARK